LGNLERELVESPDSRQIIELQRQAAEIQSAVQMLRVARPFEADLQRLRIHLRMVEDDISRMPSAAN
jgi:hypothetical protein